MIDLRQLQLEAEAVYSVDATRKTLNEIVAFFKRHPIYEEAIEVIAMKERGLTREIAERCECFFIPDDITVDDIPEEFKHESLGLCKGRYVTYAGRFVYPVKDVRGDVMGFCGWDGGIEPKYLDSKNNGYKAKETTLYGMEELPRYYMEAKPVFVVEGIVCCLYLRSQGYHALALLGSNLSPYVQEILNRLGSKVILIPDNDTVKTVDEDRPLQREQLNLNTDTSGERLVKMAMKKLPLAFIVQTRDLKDIDDTRQVYEEELGQDLCMLNQIPMWPNLIRLRRRR